MRYSRVAIILALPLSFLLFFVIPTIAQQPEAETGLVLRPAILDLPAEPGTTISATITLQNISDSAVSVEIGSQSLIPNDPEIDQTKRKDYDASTWMITSKDKLLLDEDEIRNVDVQFLVPDDAGPGGHYAMITFTTNSIAQQADSGSVVTPSLTSLALITVSGDIQENIEASRPDLPLFVFGDDQITSFDISNNGNVHVLPSATMRLYNRNDTLVDTQQINPQLILPNTTKDFVVHWSTNGRYGIYKTVIDINYGSPLQTISLEGGVTVMLPGVGTLIMWIVLLMGVIGVLFIFIRKLYKKWRNRYGHRHYRIKKKRKEKTELSNRPSDMAGLSMDSDDIDELLSRDKPQPSKTPPKKQPPKQRKKINIL